MVVLQRMSGVFLDRLQGLTTLKLFGAAERELLIDLLSRVKRDLVEQNGEPAAGAADDAGVGVAGGRGTNA